MKLMFKRILQKIKCKLGYHDFTKGFGWSRDKRYDICLKCDLGVWVEDLAGRLDMEYKDKLFKERRRVLTEKRIKTGLIVPIKISQFGGGVTRNR